MSHWIVSIRYGRRLGPIRYEYEVEAPTAATAITIALGTERVRIGQRDYGRPTEIKVVEAVPIKVIREEVPA